MKKLLLLTPLLFCSCRQPSLSVDAAKAYKEGMLDIAPMLARGVLDGRALISEIKELDCVKIDSELYGYCNDYLSNYPFEDEDLVELEGAARDFGLEIERVENGQGKTASGTID